MSFDKLKPDLTLHNVTPDMWVSNASVCSRLIDSDANWQSIPLFNYILPENLKNQQLVRFRGMIQNMCNPEFFLSKYEIRNTVTGESIIRSGKLRDTVVCEGNETFVEDSDHNENSEREKWLCVPIPALNEWVSVNWKKPHMKRHFRIEEEDLEPPKRALGDVPLPNQLPSSVPGTLEPVLPDPHSRTCYVKLYDVDTSSYVLNDVVEVAGFLYFNGKEEESEMELDDVSTSNVPQLHVVACKNLSQNSSLLPDLSLDPSIEEFQSVRKDLHLLLTQLLLGDTLAAEYFLCHLLSSVYSRTEVLALGHVPLNIINIPKTNYVKNIYNVIELFVAKSLFLPLSLENLNHKVLNPKKDYEQNQLCHGLLQLSPHTHLVLDETQMQPGMLQSPGLANMDTLKKLVLEQKVAYDFGYYALDFNCDIPVLVFSEGKSLLPCPIVVPLESDASCLENLAEIFQAAHHFLQPSMLHRIRGYIVSCQSATYTISPEMQQVIQEGFVELRQNKAMKTTVDDLHNLIVLTRLMSLSLGEPTLSAKTWEHTLNLEVQRKQRLAQLPRSSSAA